MKVNIEMQLIMHPRNKLRGIPLYILNLLNSLVRRGENDYSISFFDYGKERNNKKYINAYINTETLLRLGIYECNSISYGTLMKAQRTGETCPFRSISYNEYTGAIADVFHFPGLYTIPTNICGQMVVTVHDIMPCMDKYSKFWGPSFIDFYRNGVGLLENQTDITIIADSQNARADLIRYTKISPERIHVVPLGYDKSVHYPDKNTKILAGIGIAPGEPYLLYLAAIDPRKGVLDIVNAYKAVRKKYDGLKLVLAGGDNTAAYTAHVRTAISQTPYAGDIIMPGYVSDEQKRALLSGAEIFLFPSEYEGFGLPVLEAMACGAPVITTNISSLPEVCGDAAVYVGPNAPEQLAYEIERLLDSESLRRELTQKGLARADEFSWDKTARMTEEVYKIAYEGR